MKKAKTMMLVVLMMSVFPVLANAQEHEEVVGEVTKYYKTITRQDKNSSLYSINATSNENSETVEVSEEEYNAANTSTTSSPLASTTIETTYKKMTTTISAVSSYYRYKTTLTWKNIPSTRSYDTIAIGFPASVKAKSSASFTNEYCPSSGSCKTVTGYAYGYSGKNGVAATFKLPTGTLKSLKQTLSVDIAKNTSSTLVKLYAGGDYAHATSSVTLANAKKYSVDMVGISLESGVIKSYDSIQVADVTISCNW